MLTDLNSKSNATVNFFYFFSPQNSGLEQCFRFSVKLSVYTVRLTEMHQNLTTRNFVRFN
jgi:hypothetical protein